MTEPARPHHRAEGGFRNPWPNAEPAGFGNILKWWWQRTRAGRPADPPRGSFATATPDLRAAVPGEIAATWIGHATVLLGIGPRRVLLDPMFGRHASPVPVSSLERWMPARPTVADLPPLDLIGLSHNHYDHFDTGSIRALARAQPDVPWAVPLGLGPAVQRLGGRTVVEFDWWDEQEVGGILVGATPAQHFSARTPFDRNRTLWCGFTFRVEDQRVYFAGDTAWHPEFEAIGRRFGPFDLALIPIGAYEPRWFMRRVHCNPEDALGVYQDLLRAHPASTPVCLAIHWGTFKLTDEPLDEPPQRMRDRWREAGLPDDRLWTLRHGETRFLKR